MKRRTGQDRSITDTWRPATRAIRGGTARTEFGETSEAIFMTSGCTSRSMFCSAWKRTFVRCRRWVRPREPADVAGPPRSFVEEDVVPAAGDKLNFFS